MNKSHGTGLNLLTGDQQNPGVEPTENQTP